MKQAGHVALVLAGGIGSRINADIPKQYLRVKGRMIISYCLKTLFDSAYIDAVWIVADKDWHDAIRQELSDAQYDTTKLMGFSLPGKTRQLSIYNGICDIMGYGYEESAVLIHDAARPFLSEALIRRCFEALDGHDGVMPVLPMKDTVYMSENGTSITKLLKRENIFAGQAPELFKLGRYFEACKALLPDKILQINGSSEPAVMAGLDVVMVAGDEQNYKITTDADMERFAGYIENKSSNEA